MTTSQSHVCPNCLHLPSARYGIIRIPIGDGMYRHEPRPECNCHCHDYADQGLSLAHLREVNVRRCNTAFFQLEEWTPAEWTNALAGEVGEACNLTKKLRRGDPNITPERVGEELADAMIYIDLCAARLGLDLSEIVRKKFNADSDKKGTHIKL